MVVDFENLGYVFKEEFPEKSHVLEEGISQIRFGFYFIIIGVVLFLVGLIVWDFHVYAPPLEGFLTRGVLSVAPGEYCVGGCLYGRVPHRFLPYRQKKSTPLRG